MDVRVVDVVGVWVNASPKLEKDEKGEKKQDEMGHARLNHTLLAVTPLTAPGTFTLYEDMQWPRHHLVVVVAFAQVDDQ